MTLDDLGRSKYLSLTTFRKDGTPVATPVWLVREGDTLRVSIDGQEAGSFSSPGITHDTKSLVSLTTNAVDVEYDDFSLKAVAK